MPPERVSPLPIPSSKIPLPCAVGVKSKTVKRTRDQSIESRAPFIETRMLGFSRGLIRKRGPSKNSWRPIVMRATPEATGARSSVKSCWTMRSFSQTGTWRVSFVPKIWPETSWP